MALEATVCLKQGGRRAKVDSEDTGEMVDDRNKLGRDKVKLYTSRASTS